MYDIINALTYMSKSEYSQVSHELTKSLPKQTKREHGIYFTPPSTISNLLNNIIPKFVDQDSIRVLEPSCGSGEFITVLCEKFTDKNLHIDAIENNKTIFDSIKPIFEQDSRVKLFNEDFLDYNPTQQFDLIVGNPPYFVMKKQEVDESYYPFFDCRPNVFLLFIIKSMNHLKINGILSFVLPKSFLNCLYYNKTRELLNKEYVILGIQECRDEYIETKQETVILTLQKKNHMSENEKYMMTFHGYTIFGEEETISQLNILREHSSTLDQMGFDVNVGNVVWNQCKHILTDDVNETRLIYSSDIQNNTLGIKSYDNPEKKNFIQKEGMTGPLLVINRGYGTGNYSFQYCLLNISEPYLIENHLICIRPKSPETINKKKLIAFYRKIIKSLQNNKTKRFIQLYFGNNAINTTELKHILPIFS